MINANIIIDNPKWKKNNIKIKYYLKKKLYTLSKIDTYKKKKQTFSILLTDNNTMKKLNFKFRKKKKSTDVLSFSTKSNLIKKDYYIGDIAISYEFVKKRSLKTSFCYELDKMWVHGYLHLLGYNHNLIKDYKLMHNKEKKILKYFDHKFV